MIQLGNDKINGNIGKPALIFNFSEFVNEDGTPVDTNNLPPPTSTVSFIPSSVTVPTPTCQQSLTAVLGRGRICRGDLLFNEEFDKNNIKDLSNWLPEVMFPQEPVSTSSSSLPYTNLVGSVHRVFALQITLSSDISVINPFMFMLLHSIHPSFSS